MYKKITAFRKNVANGKKPKVEKALAELDDIIDKPDKAGWTPFMLACQNNQTHIGA